MNTSSAVAHQVDYLSVADYLEEEQSARERHEYVDGHVYAMAGASEQHEVVALNLSASLLAHMRGRGCRVFKGDMKVRLRLNEIDLFYYPDIMVCCDPADSQAYYKERPRLIVEVMTDYKADHVEKLFAYQQIAGLEEYLVISQDPEEARAWLYRKESNWAMADGAPDGQVLLNSIGFATPLRELYVME